MRSTGFRTTLRLKLRRLWRAGRRLAPLFALAALGLATMLLGVYLSQRHRIEPAPGAEKLTVGVLNVQQGECSFFRTPDGRFVVIGAGPPEQGPRVVAALRDAGVKRIDMLCLPYLYAEAIGGTGDIVGAFPVERIIEPSGPRQMNRWQMEIPTLCRTHGIALDVVHAGQSYRIGRAAKLTVVAPGYDSDAAATTGANNSLVIRVVYGRTAFVWAGGLDRAGETALLSRTPTLAADWLRVAQFGTANATSSEFLQLVSPVDAVISVGPNGKGLPAQDTLTRLQAVGATIYRTDESSGTLLFYSDSSRVTTPLSP